MYQLLCRSLKMVKVFRCKTLMWFCMGNSCLWSKVQEAGGIEVGRPIFLQCIPYICN